MTKIANHLDYETKPGGYFQYSRPEMLEFLPQHSRRVLEVGCAEGAFGESIKRGRGIEVWGVEPMESAARVATTRLDKVIASTFGPEADLPAHAFDCIYFNDVLEHMIAPERALRYAKGLLASNGVVVASIPNVRSLRTLYQVVVQGNWEYEDYGILDRTHLRFFTRSSIVKMFEREGFFVRSIRGISPYCRPKGIQKPMWWAYRLTNRLSSNRYDEMRFQQFAVVAEPSGSVGESTSEKK